MYSTEGEAESWNWEMDTHNAPQERRKKTRWIEIKFYHWSQRRRVWRNPLLALLWSGNPRTSPASLSSSTHLHSLVETKDSINIIVVQRQCQHHIVQRQDQHHSSMRNTWQVTTVLYTSLKQRDLETVVSANQTSSKHFTTATLLWRNCATVDACTALSSVVIIYLLVSLFLAGFVLFLLLLLY